MPSFEVDTRHLTHTVAPRFMQMESFYSSIGNWSQQWLVDEVEDSSGFHADGKELVANANEALSTFFGDQIDFWIGSAQEILQTAYLYDSTEQSQLEEMDASFSDWSSSPVAEDSATPRADIGPDVPEPTISNPFDELHTPSPQIAVDIADAVTSTLGDAISPSGVAAWVCRQVFGSDPLTWLKDQLGPDWRDISRAADWMDTAGNMQGAINHHAAEAAWCVTDRWSGYAAEDAKAQMRRGSEVADDVPGIMRAIGKDIQTLASEVYALATLVGTAIGSALDALASAIFPPLLPLAVSRVLSVLGEVLTLLGIGIAALWDLITGAQGNIDDLRNIPAVAGSATSYDNPTVG